MASRQPTSVAPVPPKQLADLVWPALKACEHISDYNESMSVFAAHVEKALLGAEDIEVTLFYMRALLTFQCLFDDGEHLAAAEILRPREDGVTDIPPAFFHAVASAPLGFDINKSGVRLRYEITDVIDAAKRWKANAGTIHFPGPNGRPVLVDGDISDAFQALKSLPAWREGASLGEMLAANSTEPFWYDPDDFPHYMEMMGERKRQLAGMPRIESSVYDAEPLPDDHQSVRVAAGFLASFPPDLLALTGFGPWSRYPMLDQTAAWDVARYLSVVTISPLHASVPCRRGLYPAYYAMLHGTLAQFETILSLWPQVLHRLDAEGRPLLLDLAQRRCDEKFACAVAMGADLHLASRLGHTAMYGALKSGNHNAIEVLIDADYNFEDDPRVDRQLVLRFLAEPTCPPEVRVKLDAATHDLPERSELNAELDELAATLRRLG